VAIEKIDLLLKLVWRGPVVVAVEQGDVVSMCGPDAARDHLVAAQVVVRQQEPDPIRKLARIVADDLARAVRRAIFTDQDFVVEGRLLG
jgi:hypothetical protein